MVPITITRPLTLLTHWRIAARQKLIGTRASTSPGLGGPKLAIAKAG
jgi:hypothetical protein